MAVPKTKKSKSRTNSRYHANSKLTAPALVECPHCHEMKLPHVVCKACGYYDGKEVVAKSEN
ncbi:MAG: 50S ribosomal protein L32 [Clostridia bacterium]|nr:50S ribosomal protein L32 [Clostridia bacterium]